MKRETLQIFHRTTYRGQTLKMKIAKKEGGMILIRVNQLQMLGLQARALLFQQAMMVLSNRSLLIIEQS